MTKNCRMDLNWIEARKVATKTIVRCSPAIDKDLLEDIVQDTIERALIKLSHFDETKGAFNAWVATIARNVFVDYTRKNGKCVFISYDFINVTNQIDDDYIELEELELSLLNAVEELKERDKTLIKMRHFDNLSYGEIGKLTGIPKNSVPVYIMRARKELKKYYIQKQNYYAA